MLPLQPEKPPGTDFQYSNANAAILGIVLQRVTGKRYAQYLSERLWMASTGPAAVWLDHEGGVPARSATCTRAPRLVAGGAVDTRRRPQRRAAGDPGGGSVR